MGRPQLQVSCSLVGPVVLDILQHFTERWNEVKLRKHTRDECVVLHIYKDIDLMQSRRLQALRLTRITARCRGCQCAERNCCRFARFGCDKLYCCSNFPAYLQREQWQDKSHSFQQDIHSEKKVAESGEGHHGLPHGTARVQVCRSASDWSHGILNEYSIQNACEEAELCFLAETF